MSRAPGRQDDHRDTRGDTRSTTVVLPPEHHDDTTDDHEFAIMAEEILGTDAGPVS